MLTAITLSRRFMAILSFALVSQAAQADELVIPGSGNPEYVLQALADAFAKHQSQHRVVIPPSSGTAGALQDVLGGKAVLGRVGRALRSDEAAKGFSYIPLGRDPVAFVGGAGVTIKGLTSAQVLDLYSGRLTNWKEIGGKLGPVRSWSWPDTESRHA